MSRTKPPEFYKGLYAGGHMVGGEYEDNNWRKIADAFFGGGPDGDSSERWDDQQAPGYILQPGAAAPDLISFMGDSDVKIYGFAGTGAVTEVLTGLVQFTHRYKVGSDVHVHVHWSPSTTDSGNVVWQFAYSWANVEDIFPALTTVAGGADAAVGQWAHQIVPIVSIDGTGKLESSIMVFKLCRDPTHGSDDYEADAGLLELDVHILANKLGTIAQDHGT